MSNIHFYLVAGLIILIGLVLSLKRKYFINREYIGIFLVILNSVPFIDNNIMTYFFMYTLPFSLLAIMILRKRFTIINVNKEMVTDTLKEILAEKNISYRELDDSLILLGYHNSSIYYNQSANSVEINMREVDDSSLAKELICELKVRIKQINEVVFPKTGLFFILLGLVLIVLLETIFIK